MRGGALGGGGPTVTQPARAGIDREGRGRQAANDLFPEDLLKGRTGGLPVMSRVGAGVCSRRTRRAALRLAQELLGVILQFLDLPLLPRGGIECLRANRLAVRRDVSVGWRDAQPVKESREGAVRAGPGGHPLGTGDELEPVEILSVAGLE